MKSNLYFKLDLYAIENDSEFRYVCSEHPVWGYGVFIYTVSLLYRNNGQPINKKILVMDVAHGLFTDNREKVEEIIDLCVELGLLKTDGNGLYSTRVQTECRKQIEFKQRQSERGIKGMQKRWGKDVTPSATDNDGVTPVITDDNQRYNHTITNKQEQEQDKEKDISKEISKKKVFFLKPTLQEVQEYCKERGNNVDAEKWMDYYESVGWYVGKNKKMKDWKASVRTWEHDDNRSTNRKATVRKDYSDVKAEELDTSEFNWGV